MVPASSVRAGQPIRVPGTRSVLANVRATREALVGQIAGDVAAFGRHPLDTLGGAARGAAFPLIHPLRTAKSLTAGIDEDPASGSVDAAATASGALYVGTLLVAGLAVVAAPVTGGASLGVAAWALSLGYAAAWACVATNFAGIALHLLRGATATSEAAAAQEGRIAAAFIEDQAILAATWFAGDLLEARLARRAGRVADVASRQRFRLSNDAIGIAGVYDSPDDLGASSAT